MKKRSPSFLIVLSAFLISACSQTLTSRGDGKAPCVEDPTQPGCVDDNGSADGGGSNGQGGGGGVGPGQGGQDPNRPWTNPWTGPFDGNCGDPEADADGDGMPDCTDECPTDPQKIEGLICGCSVPDVDGNGDGECDHFDEVDQCLDAGELELCECINLMPPVNGIEGPDCDEPDPAFCERGGDCVESLVMNAFAPICSAIENVVPTVSCLLSSLNDGDPAVCLMLGIDAVGFVFGDEFWVQLERMMHNVFPCLVHFSQCVVDFVGGLMGGIEGMGEILADLPGLLLEDSTSLVGGLLHMLFTCGFDGTTEEPPGEVMPL